MLMNLKTQELMHGFESLSIGRMDDNLPSAIGLGILDLAVLIAKSVPAAPAPPAATSAGAREHASLFPPLFHSVASHS